MVTPMKSESLVDRAKREVQEEQDKETVAALKSKLHELRIAM